MGPSTASDDAGSRGAGSANRSAWQRVGRAVREPGRAAGYVQRPVAQAMSPRALYLDPHHDLRRSVFVAGSRRSGSTLLAEVLTAGNRLRLMFEPMRRDRVPLSRNVPEGVFVPPDDDAAALAHVVTRVLTGRLRSSWADRYNTCRLARGRVVKEVRLNNLLPWMVRRYPAVPIVYLLRHPLATAWSSYELQTPIKLGEYTSQPFLMGALTAAQRALVERTPSEKTVPAYVLRWCLENALPVQLLGAADVHVVLYEDLVREPAGEMARLAEFLGRRQPSMWGAWRPDPGVLARPSHSSWRDDKERPPTGEQRVAGWHDAMGRGLIEEAMTMVAAFGLDRIYGDGTSPRVGASDVLRGPPSAH